MTGLRFGDLVTGAECGIEIEERSGGSLQVIALALAGVWFLPCFELASTSVY
jgi:hypothetical protein